MRLIGVILLSLLSQIAFAQEFSAEFKDRSQVEIGEGCPVELVFRYPSRTGNAEIITHKSGYLLGKQLEWLSDEPQRINDDGSVSEIFKTVYVIAWDSGGFVIPPFVAYYNGDSIYSNSLNLEVSGMPIDIEKKPKDINGLYEVEWTLLDQLTYLLLNYWYVWALLLVLIAVFILRDKLKSKINEKRHKKELPPYELSINVLNEINIDNFLNSNDIKGFYTKVSESLRIYIACVIDTSVKDMTSEQILQALSNVSVDPKIKQKLRRILLHSDMAKFAKASADRRQCQEDKEDAIVILEALKEYVDNVE